MAYFTAQHESGKSWRLATPPRLTGDVMNTRAKNFARNYCLKNRLTGDVTLINEETRDEFTLTVKNDYSI